MSNVEGTRPASLRAITPGLTVFITGPVTTLSIDTDPVQNGTQDVLFAFNSGPSDNGPSAQGTIDISGVISGAGIVQFGTQEQGAALPLGKVILRGNNTHTGLNVASRGTLVLGHDNALGTGAIRNDGPSGIGMTGFNIESTDNSRSIANEVRLANWATINGENSITFSGRAYTTNTAGWINMLPTSNTLTLSGVQYVHHMEFKEEGDTLHRIYTFDGKGVTKVTGGIHGRWDQQSEVEVIKPNNPSSIAKQGSGAVYVDGGNDATAGTLDSNFNESVIVWQGNLHFGSNGDFAGAEYFTTKAGAVGVKTGGVVDDGEGGVNSTFLNKLNSASSKFADEAGNLVLMITAA
jgi:hypothetical protein